MSPLPRQIQSLQPDEVYAVLGSRPQGLTATEAAARLAEIGSNRVENEERFVWLDCLGRQFGNFFTLLLIAAAFICFAADRLQPDAGMASLGGVIALVALLNALFAFVQEFRAEKAMAALRAYLPQQIAVVRDGRERMLLVSDLVPGDVVLIAEGDQIPADLRLVSASGLSVSNAPLTGEAHPLERNADPCQAPLLESSNLLFAGCPILSGEGKGVVFATGLRSEFGKIAHLSQAQQRDPSPLERQIAQLVRRLAAISLAIGLTFFLFSLWRGIPLWLAMVLSMGIVVANVPEGLLPTMTLSLALASQRMARRQVLVRGLNAVESLGAVHLICTDKTGTLTENRLSVQQTVAADGSLADLSLTRLACAASLTEPGTRHQIDPLDEALRAAGAADAERIRLLRRIPFVTSERRSRSIVSIDGEVCIVVKGAFESLAPRLQSLQGADGVRPADAAGLAGAEKVMLQLAGAGLRVIAVAWRTLSPEETGRTPQELEEGLTLAGFCGIADCLRPEVPEAVSRAFQAGVHVCMITGDHPQTALAIARAAGIVTADAGSAAVLTGEALRTLSQADLAAAIAGSVRIFARTSPEEKMKIIAAARSLDWTVAMTGDGVNDAPALKAADVGIAMGKNGSEVARATARIILLDDNFASIVAGIEEGRTVFANMRRFTTYILSHALPELTPYLVAALLPVPAALTVTQILFVDLCTDILPALGLGSLPPDPAVMSSPPRPRGARLLDGSVLRQSYLVAGLAETLWSQFLFYLVLVTGGWHFGSALNVADPLYLAATGTTLAAIVAMQAGNVLCSLGPVGTSFWQNRFLSAGLFLQILTVAAIFYWPPAQRFLGTAPVDPWIVVLTILGAPLMLLVVRLAGRFNDPESISAAL